MTWVHPLFLIALLGISIPIYLHLWGRRKVRPVFLPTIEFLRRAIEARQRQRKWREIALLFLRCGILTAAVLVMARPIFTSRVTTASALPQEVHILIDNSASMLARDGSESMFHRAQKEALRLLLGLNPRDRASITPLLGSSGVGLTNDQVKLRAYIEHLEVRYESTLWLPRVLETLTAVDSRQRANLWIITDGRMQGWKPVRSITTLKREAEFFILDVSGGKRFFNSSITSMHAQRYFQGTAEKFLLTTNFNNDTEKNRRLQAKLETLAHGTWTNRNTIFIDISDNSQATSKIELEGSGPVQHLRMVLEDDDFSLDNLAHISLVKAGQKSVLIVNGAPRSLTREDASTFVTAALRAHGAKESFHVEETTLSEFKSVPRGTDLVLLLDTGEMTREQSLFLTRYAISGGTLFIGAGDSFQRVEPNSPVSSLLPAVLRSIASFAIPVHMEKPSSATHVGLLHAFWEESIRKATFSKLVLMDPVQRDQVWISSTSKNPILVAKELELGKVIFFTSSLNQSWNNFVLFPTFPAFLRNLIRQSTTSKEVSTFKSFTIGQPVFINELFPDPWKLESTLPQSPGFYPLTFRKNKELAYAYLAAQVDPSETDLKPFLKEEIESRLAPFKVSWAQSNAQSSLVKSDEKIEQSPRFAWICFWFLVIESFLAGRIPIRMFKPNKKTALTLALMLFSTTSLYALGDASKIEMAAVDLHSTSPYPRPLEYLLARIEFMTHVEAKKEIKRITFLDNDLFKFPFMYASAEGAFTITSPERDRLKTYLEKGGFLFFDDPSGGSGSFNLSVGKLMELIFPQAKAFVLPTDHSIFRSFFLLDRGYGRLSESVLRGWNIGGRTAAVYFSGDLAGALALDPTGAFISSMPGGELERTMAVRFGVNVILYALTLDYKQDQIHIPFILKRRK